MQNTCFQTKNLPSSIWTNGPNIFLFCPLFFSLSLFYRIPKIFLVELLSRIVLSHWINDAWIKACSTFFFDIFSFVKPSLNKHVLLVRMVY